MLVVAGSRSDQCPSGALNRTSGPALLAGGHRFGRQTGPHRQTLICVWAVGGGVPDAPGNLAIIATFRANRRGGFYIRPGSFGGDVGFLRANTVRPYALLSIGAVGKGA